MKRHFEVMYWGYNSSDGTELTTLHRTVTVPDDTMKALMSGSKTEMYHFIVEDGQLWLLPASLLCEVIESDDYWAIKERP